MFSPCWGWGGNMVPSLVGGGLRKGGKIYSFAGENIVFQKNCRMGS